MVEDFSYGAVAVAHRLRELAPRALVVVGAEQRGRPPGTVVRQPVTGLAATVDELQSAVHEAVTGYVSVALLLEVAHALGALPEEAVAIEVEPARTEPSEVLSPEAERGLADALELVRAEIERLRAQR